MPIDAAIKLGVASGMRSLMGVTAASWAASSGRRSIPPGTPLTLLENHGASIILTLCQVGEIVADKLPGIPNRTSPGPLLGRICFGSLAGFLVGEGNSSSRWSQAVVGGAAAGVATFVTHSIRREVGALGVPDLILAVIEDAAVILLARSTVRALDTSTS